MSNAVELSRSVHVRVDELVETLPGYDARRERFSTPAVAPWVPGRLTLTRMRVSYVVTRAGSAARSFVVDLTDVEAVEIERSRVPRVVTLRTADRLIHVRTSGAHAFAKRVAIAREAAQRA